MHKSNGVYETPPMRAALDLYSLHKEPQEDAEPDEKPDLPDEIRELLRQNEKMAKEKRKNGKERF